MIQTIRYCDKCKKEFDCPNHLKIDFYMNYKFPFIPAKEYDLCTKCTKKLEKWINDDD